MMVNRYDASHLLLVLQVDHSRVAGLLAAHWGNATFARPQPYASVVVAAQEHDSGWWDWEIKPTLNAQGYPMDYITGGGLDRAVHLAFDRHGITRVLEQDPYAGLLVSMHLAGLNTQGFGVVPHMTNRQHIPGVQEFLDEQEALRAGLLAELRQSPEHADFATDERIWTNYRLLEICDQLAQYICNHYPLNSTERRNGPPNQLRFAPVAPGRDDATLAVDVQDERSAILAPYPFDVDPLEIAFPARVVPDRPYASQDEFLRDYYAAPRVTITYTLRAA